MFKEMFGEEFMKFTAFVYTHHDNSQKYIDDRIKENITDHQYKFYLF